jgi:hypothetical protein
MPKEIIFNTLNNPDTPLRKNMHEEEIRLEAAFKFHLSFDPVWKLCATRLGIDKRSARTAAYGWLSRAFNVEAGLVHGSAMNTTQCVQCCKLCRVIKNPLIAYLKEPTQEKLSENVALAALIDSMMTARPRAIKAKP